MSHSETPSHGDVLMTRSDVMHYFRVKSRTTIDNWMSASNFPEPITMGGSQRWRLSEVVKWSTNQADRKPREDGNG